MLDMTDRNAKMHNLYYAFYLGPALIISISTEIYFFYEQYGIAQIYNQNAWLEKTLIHANEPQNRLKHPWIVVCGHRPLYCTGASTSEDCHSEAIWVLFSLLDN